jgi:hypothetical protein
MDARLFETVYHGLTVESDVSLLSARYGIDLDTIKVILHQKIVRETMHHHHNVKNNATNLKKQWKEGKTILEIAKTANFSPVMTAWLILEQEGISRSYFRALLRNPDAVKDVRLKRELLAAIKKDLAYAPDIIANQVERSKMVEEAVRHWLVERGVLFIDEQEGKKRQQVKTPDFLLKKPLPFEGGTLHWIECKASFGDGSETRRDYAKQLRHYVALYSAGMVVYWYGLVDGIQLPGVTLANRSLFEKR